MNSVSAWLLFCLELILFDLMKWTRKIFLKFFRLITIILKVTKYFKVDKLTIERKWNTLLSTSLTYLPLHNNPAIPSSSSWRSCRVFLSTINSLNIKSSLGHCLTFRINRRTYNNPPHCTTLAPPPHYVTGKCYINCWASSSPPLAHVRQIAKAPAQPAWQQ